ncbi:MAG: prefoldin subunit beta [Desulfurococcales archaeon]|nr:prefoldin subunit beta [Desulfurococcales archaeon]
MVEKVPSEAEAKYNKYVQLRETLNALAQERITVEGSLAEIESLLEKLKELPGDADLYKMEGYILVKATRDSIMEELNKRKEDLEIRLKALKSQEDSLKRELERLAEELKRLLARQQGGAGGLGGL